MKASEVISKESAFTKIKADLSIFRDLGVIVENVNDNLEIKTLLREFTVTISYENDTYIHIRFDAKIKNLELTLKIGNDSLIPNIIHFLLGEILTIPTNSYPARRSILLKTTARTPRVDIYEVINGRPYRRSVNIYSQLQLVYNSSLSCYRTFSIRFDAGKSISFSLKLETDLLKLRLNICKLFNNIREVTDISNKNRQLTEFILKTNEYLERLDCGLYFVECNSDLLLKNLDGKTLRRKKLSHLYNDIEKSLLLDPQFMREFIIHLVRESEDIIGSPKSIQINSIKFDIISEIYTVQFTRSSYFRDSYVRIWNPLDSVTKFSSINTTNIECFINELIYQLNYHKGRYFRDIVKQLIT